MRLDIFLACAAIGPLAWLLSLRRTPWSRIWFVCALAGVAWSGMAFVFTLASMAGNAAIVAAPLLITTLVSVGTTEAMALDHTGDVHSWRRSRRRVRHHAWQVCVTPAEGTFHVGVTDGPTYRAVGYADPAKDPEAYAALLAEGESMAATYNAWKVTT